MDGWMHSGFASHRIAPQPMTEPVGWWAAWPSAVLGVASQGPLCYGVSRVGPCVGAGAGGARSRTALSAAWELKYTAMPQHLTWAHGVRTCSGISEARAMDGQEVGWPCSACGHAPAQTLPAGPCSAARPLVLAGLVSSLLRVPALSAPWGRSDLAANTDPAGGPGPGCSLARLVQLLWALLKPSVVSLCSA